MDEQQKKTTSESQKSNLNPLLIVVILIIIAAVGAMLWLGNSKNTNQAAKVVPTTTQAQEPTAIATQGASESATVKAIAVEGGAYYFKPNEIKVKKGDKVKITFTNAGGIHDFVIDAYNVKTERIANGKSTTVEFVADKVGTFEYYCSVGNHRQMGMTGKLIVSQ